MLLCRAKENGAIQRREFEEAAIWLLLRNSFDDRLKDAPKSRGAPTTKTVGKDASNCGKRIAGSLKWKSNKRASGLAAYCAGRLPNGQLKYSPCWIATGAFRSDRRLNLVQFDGPPGNQDFRKPCDFVRILCNDAARTEERFLYRLLAFLREHKIPLSATSA